jgi:ABC-type transport system substrate-binding protein
MMELDQAKQFKEPQKESARLKRMLADEMLDRELLKEALEKTMSAGHKRQIIVATVDRGRFTTREACRHFGLHRSSFSYDAKQPDAWMAKLKAALRRISREHPEMGYMKIARLLKKAGWRVGSRFDPTITPTARFDGAREEA